MPLSRRPLLLAAAASLGLPRLALKASEALAVARDEGLYSHVDAAWAGAAMICPEFRDLWQGIEAADGKGRLDRRWYTGMTDPRIERHTTPVPQASNR